MANSARKIIATGNSAGSTNAISGDTANTLTALGSTQGTAFPLVADNNAFSTVAASTGAVLYAGTPGDESYVYNGGANALTVYPPPGGTINNLSANAGFSIATTKSCVFMQIGAAAWAANLSA